jgi:hypothetical protein
MEITPAGVVGPAQAARTRPRSGGAAFVLAPETPEAEAGAAGEPVAGGIAAAGVSGLAALLALQESEAASARDRAARRHGQALLEDLAALQRGLLAGLLGPGGVDPALPGRLAALAEQVPEAADPALAAIISAIAVRARVELARLGL